MNISDIFIRRPVMTTLLMAAFLLAGVIGYVGLPVSELPTFDNPTVSVFAHLQGANPSTMASTIATPLEKQFSTIPGVLSMNSRSSQGVTVITLTFELSRNIDLAAQDVQAAVSATPGLPIKDMQQPPRVQKANTADLPILVMRLSSKTLPLSTVNEYSENVLIRKLSTLDGVASIDINGESRYAIRIQVDPDALAVRGIGIDQVSNAIVATNVNQGTGSLDGATRATVIQTQGLLFDSSSFAKQIVAYRDGKPVRFADIGTVLDSTQNNKNYNMYNGEPTISLGILRQPGSNTVAVVDEVLAALPELKSQLPPSVNLEIIFDRSQTIRASIHDVQVTMLFSALLVVAVIFLFLRTVTATLIPSVAMPIAIIGTFAGMNVLGYSLDNLSLMALTLSVIFIVDDAIVMLENIMRHVERGETPREAAFKGSGEVASTILTMTLSLAAVFIPVLFMGGILGRLLHEFAVTIVTAIVISGVVSVTLTPMLCSRVIRRSHNVEGSRQQRFNDKSEAVFNWVQAGYARSLKWSMDHRLFIVILFFVSIATSYFFFSILPQDFLPADDAGQVNVTIQAANGTSFADMVRRQMVVEKMARDDPSVLGVTSTVLGGNGAGSSIGKMTLRLKPIAERPGHMPIDNVMAELRRKMQTVPGLKAALQNPPSFRIGGLATTSQYQYTLQDADQQELYASSTRLRDALDVTPGFTDVSTNLDLTTPSVNVDIDRDNAAKLGVSVQQIEGALGSAFGGGQVSTIYGSTNQYQVILELLPQFQQDPASLARLYLTGTNGSLVPLTAVTKMTPGSIALSENHLGQLPAVTISFNLEPGLALSDAVTRLKNVEAQIGLPANVQGSFQGTAQAFQESMAGMGYLLVGGILVVYIMLGILYESFIHPLTILSGLPAAASGALLTLWIFGIPLTLYAYVGLIMLIGIVKKNAIMMIDFALARQRQDGLEAEEAIVEAALVRFRPIMMTTMAALVGAVPIALGLGSGGAGRQPLGVAVVGGLMVSQALTLYITPVIYGYLDRFEKWISGSKRRQQAVPAE